MRTTGALVLLAVFAAACGTVEVGDEENTVDLIDDLEDGDGEILASGGRQGTWFTINDGIGNQMPYPDFVATAGGANESEYSVNTTGMGFDEQSGWAKVGMFLNKELEADSGDYDVSGYTGIQFYARSLIPGTSEEHDVRVALRTRAVVDVKNGGDCVPRKGERGLCNDYHGRDVDLSPEWTLHQVPFDIFQQDEWGQVIALDLTTVIAIDFELDERHPNFDLWLDDVAFYTAGEAAAHASGRSRR